MAAYGMACHRLGSRQDASWENTNSASLVLLLRHFVLARCVALTVTRKGGKSGGKGSKYQAKGTTKGWFAMSDPYGGAKVPQQVRRVSLPAYHS